MIDGEGQESKNPQGPQAIREGKSRCLCYRGLTTNRGEHNHELLNT